VVDDNRDAADSLQILARLWGHDARAAYGGASALELARAFRPHLILLDLGMPGVDGWEVARLLREDARTGTALLLEVSGYGRREDVGRSLDAGFHGHLTKPADPEQLRRVIDRLADVLPLAEGVG
jgi:CheY-like chemotaxis protein